MIEYELKPVSMYELVKKGDRRRTEVFDSEEQAIDYVEGLAGARQIAVLNDRGKCRMTIVFDEGAAMEEAAQAT